MATLRKRNGKWQVQVRRQGHAPVSKSFINRKDAEAWARDVERRFDQGESLPIKRHADTRTLGDLLRQYRETITPLKKSASVERYRIDKMLRHPISEVKAEALTPAQVAAYRDERLASVSGETTRQDLVLFRQVLDVARREWGLKISPNPVDDVRKPAPREGQNASRAILRFEGNRESSEHVPESSPEASDLVCASYRHAEGGDSSHGMEGRGSKAGTADDPCHEEWTCQDDTAVPQSAEDRRRA